MTRREIKDMLSMARYRVAASVLLLVLAVWTGCNRSAPSPGSSTSLLVITADTLRADALRCYGDARRLTPVLDAVADEGVLFENAYCQMPLTRASHASLFTGLMPPNHGVRGNADYRLADEFVTMAELLKDAGYQTGAVIGSYVLASKFGLAQGFDHFDDNIPPDPQGRVHDTTQRDAANVRDNSLAWLRDASPPFFLWSHFFDPHAPYDPPTPFTEAAGNPYSGEVLFVDQSIGPLIQAAQKKSGGDLLVVFTADHGESLGEHGEETHGFFLYRGSMRVPLLILFPDGRYAGTRVDDFVQTVDLFPSVLNWLGVPTEEETDGLDLTGVIEGKGHDTMLYGESLYPARFGWSPIRSIQRGNWKLIDAPKPELYELSQDPDEVENRFEDSPEIARELADALSRYGSWGSDLAKSAGSTLTAEERERLEALGYIQPMVREGSELKDPKDHISEYRLYLDALRLSNDGDWEGAETVLQNLLAEDDTAPEPWFRLGQVLEELGKIDEAADAYRRSLNINPNVAYARSHLARSLIKQGSLEEASSVVEQGISMGSQHPDLFRDRGDLAIYRSDFQNAAKAYRDALKLAPDDVNIRYSLGTTYLTMGRANLAVRELETVIKTQKRVLEVRVNLAIAYFTNKNYEESEQLFKAILEDEPDVAEVHLAYGNLLATTRRYDQATIHWQRVLELDPENAPAKSGLETLKSLRAGASKDSP